MTSRNRIVGFTLLEALAGILLTALVLGVALNFYVDLSRAGQRAVENTRRIRRAIAILDRVSRDFESVVLVQKPVETDTLSHPWVFLGESHYSAEGSDRIKFVTRGHRPRNTAQHESDLVVVTYITQQGEDGDLELLRSLSTQLPEGLDRDLLYEGDEDAFLLADGLVDFNVKFVDSSGDIQESWDSSQLVDSSELPFAVDIAIAVFNPDDEEGEPLRFSRRVLLPVRPLDLEELLDPTSAVSGGLPSEETVAESGDDEDDFGNKDRTGDPDGGLTVGQCVNISAVSHSPSTVLLYEQYKGMSYAAVRHVLPALFRNIAKAKCK